jgi:subtilisin family serine protease
MSRLLLMAILMAASVVATPATQSASDKEQAASGAAFYYYGERRIRLERSGTEVVVGFDAAQAVAVEEAVRALLPQATLRPGAGDARRSYSVVTLDAVASTMSSDAAAGQLSGVGALDFVAPVFRDPVSGAKLLPTDEIIVKAKGALTADGLAVALQAFDVSVDRQLRGADDEFVLRVGPDTDVIQRARQIHESGVVAWAEPNFVQEYRKSSTPNDPRYSQMWHLLNTGQGPNGGNTGADIAAPSAWDIEVGNSSVVIAIVDDGVDLAHEDLAPNLFVNPGEIPGNGFDDDQNGFVDDVRGWDFAGNDSNASPTSSPENHGTAVAGIAAARGNNGIGITGVCQRCSLLPVKVVNGQQFVSTDRLAEALRYAASFADIINNSWGGGAPSATLESALQFAATFGRHGRGTVVFSAAGNGAGGNVELATTLPAGTHRFRWTYSKDESVVAGDDTAWLAAVVFPGNFFSSVFGQGPLPNGWTTGGDAPWSHVHDPVHADEGGGWPASMRAGAIADGQSSYIEAVQTVTAGTFRSLQYVSSEPGFDGLRVQIDFNNDGTFDLSSGLLTGLPPTGVAYPAAYPQSIAVGAVSNYDYRSHYSQFGPELAFLAPGSAGYLNAGIHTTDRSGSSGYSSSSYADDFSGTSSSTPVAAGVAGLMLSRNPTLTPLQVKQILQDTADKVGGVAVVYVNGRHERYGSGRIDAFRALSAVPLPSAVEPPAVLRQPASQMVPFQSSARLSVEASGTSLLFQWYRGAPGDITTPVSGATAAVFDTPAVTAPTTYWVRVSNVAGSADSSASDLTVGAAFDGVLGAPRCYWLSGVCDSGWLLNGRGLAGPEPHQPNSLQMICSDGTGDRAIGSIDRIRVTPLTVQFTSGQLVRVEVDTVTSLRAGRLELFLADTPSAPNWIRFATLDAPFIGAHTFVAIYALPPARLQAIRARLHQSSLQPDYGSCGSPDPYTDSDDIVFPSSEALSVPRILIQPRGGIQDDSGAYNIGEVFVGAIGTATLQYQWYRGVSGDTSRPITTGLLPYRPYLNQVDRTVGTAYYWVRVSNTLGFVDSDTVTVTTANSAMATYNSFFKAPLCPLTYSCWATTTGRGTVGPEMNQPNTLFATCQDGTGGRSSDESIDSIRFYTPDRLPPAPGKPIIVTATVKTFSGLHDRLDFYSAADANNPVWTHIATLRPLSSPHLTAEFMLPYGTLQAVRARFRYQGTEGPCGGAPGSYDDHDDLVFPTVASATMAPVIAAQPRSAVAAAGQPHTLSVTASGPSLVYQWYRGASGFVGEPLPQANSRTLTVAVTGGTTQYWVRVSSPGGSADSAAATIKGAIAATAAANPVLRAPVCLSWSAWCDSATVLVGRSGVGPEINAPNTLAATCVDGSSGRFHVDESIDAIRISTVDGEPFVPGATVKVDVSAWIFSQFYDVVDVFQSASATAPVWVHVASITPESGGAQTLSTGYVLPAGTLQAVRARLRYRGVANPCGLGPYDDHDDLAFSVGGPTTLNSSVMTLTGTSTMSPASPLLPSTNTAPVIWPGYVSGASARSLAAVASSETPEQIERYREAERVEMTATRERNAFVEPAAVESPVRASTSAVSSTAADTTASASEKVAEPLTEFLESRMYALRYSGKAISYAEAWFRRSPAVIDQARSCILYIERASNAVLLLNDSGDELLRATIGHSGSLRNRQCAVDMQSVRVTATEDGLVVSLTVRLNRDYAVTGVYSQTVDAAGNSSGWTLSSSPSGATGALAAEELSKAASTSPGTEAASP